MDESHLGQLKRFIREDWKRLGEEETWNEMIFSFGVVLTIFLILFTIMEFGMALHRGSPSRLGLATGISQSSELLDLDFHRVTRLEEDLRFPVEPHPAGSPG